MQFRSLSISNFRGIGHFSVEDLSDFVMIAGPNGCGKTCVFDAIRLLKSIYGGYAPNEWQHFFGELQIDLSRQSDFKRLFRDSECDLKISARIELSFTERQYFQTHAAGILEPYLWGLATGQDISHRKFAPMAMATQSAETRAQVQQQLADRLPNFIEAVAQPIQEISITLRAEPGQIISDPNEVISVLFATYDPENIGLIEYHSASRAYQREALGGIDLNVRNFDEQRRQSTLYNWQNKYTNIKSELAATYLRDLVATEAGQDPTTASANETIKELFRNFFPDKEYLGVRPEQGGTLSFPVRLANGDVHDINELSSGEKELVYGYLRLRNSAPHNSTILLDEPELHLNPGLLRGLLSFYHQHLGKQQGNQLWLVTHSDALLRQAVGNPAYSTFHMTPLTAVEAEDENQAVPLVGEDDVERSIISIVGDLATYKPTGRIVIVEGGGDTEFDVNMITRLLPSFAKRVNLISGRDKRRVKDLFEMLAESGNSLGVRGRFFAIVDRDNDAPVPKDLPNSFTWDVYHIENFLLESSYILKVVNAIAARDVYKSIDEVDLALKRSATKVVNQLVYGEVRKLVHDRIVNAIKIAGPSDGSDLVAALTPSMDATFVRLRNVESELHVPTLISSEAAKARTKYEQSLSDESWRSSFPRRRILKQLTSDLGPTVANYEQLRNLILDRMEADNYRPEGMAAITDHILATPIDTD